MSRQDFKLGVMVSGRGSNLQAIIDNVENGKLNASIAVVISDTPDALALSRGKKHGIESIFLDPAKYSGKEEYDQALIDLLNSKSIDLVCLAGFMRILSSKFTQAFDGKIINIHPSLLPAFQGLNVQKKALEYGVKYAGCTVHFVDDSVDGGPVIAQAVVPVYDSDSVEALSDRILEQEHLIYSEAIQIIIENRISTDGRKIRLKKN